ncbi:MAG: aminotransferase class IV [Eubacteriales bacterium]
MNGVIRENCVIPVDMGYLYGYGIFETIKVMEKKMIFYNEHMHRLKESAGKVHIDWDEENSKIEEECYNVLKKNKLSDGAVRVTIGKSSTGHNLVISCRESSYFPEKYARGFNLTISPYHRNEHALLVSIKSNNYLENLLILEEARRQGFGEAIFFNSKGYLAEGTMSNIFFVEGKCLYTPAEDCGILGGIVRNKIIKILIELKVPFEEGYYTRVKLMRADEVFICNSLMDMMPVNRIDATKYKLGNNTLTNQLTRKYKETYYGRM